MLYASPIRPIPFPQAAADSKISMPTFCGGAKAAPQCSHFSRVTRRRLPQEGHGSRAGHSFTHRNAMSPGKPVRKRKSIQPIVGTVGIAERRQSQNPTGKQIGKKQAATMKSVFGSNPPALRSSGLGNLTLFSTSPLPASHMTCVGSLNDFAKLLARE